MNRMFVLTATSSSRIVMMATTTAAAAVIGIYGRFKSGQIINAPPFDQIFSCRRGWGASCSIYGRHLVFVINVEAEWNV